MDKVLDIGIDQLWEAVNPEHPGDGWYTAQAVADRQDIQLTVARYRLETGYRNGTVDRQKVGGRVYYKVKV